VTYTLVADGSADKILVPILTWSLRQYTSDPISEQWADFSRIPRQRDLVSRLRTALDLYPCDVLFIHRDAEAQPHSWRRNEIDHALRDFPIIYVPVVPVRMSEAWLLLYESPIRAAAGNPNGKDDLGLPHVSSIEAIADPKKVLHSALVAASGLNLRRRSKFPVQQRVHLIPNHIEDYQRLHSLPAFQRLQDDIRSALRALVDRW